MDCYGLIGHPLGHSFSKAFFSEKFEREAIDACYDLFDLESINDFPQLLSKHPDLCGFNVTIPYKEAIMPYMDVLDPEAEAVGAVNTVKVLADGRLKGFNTDIIGIETTLMGLRGTPKGASVTPEGGYVAPLELFGFRGTPKGASVTPAGGYVVPLGLFGFRGAPKGTSVTPEGGYVAPLGLFGFRGTPKGTSVTPEGSYVAPLGLFGFRGAPKGTSVTPEGGYVAPLGLFGFRGAPKGTSVTPAGSYVVPLGHLEKPITALILGTGGASKAVQYVLKKHSVPCHLVSRNPHKGDFTYNMLTPIIINEHPLIINASPVGMSPRIEEAPLIPYEAVTAEHLLFDLVYNPEETLFLRYGREHGATTVNGMAMLLAQAEASWRIWQS